MAPTAAILWDSHHTWKKGGEDPAALWWQIHSNVVHVHVKDSVSSPGRGDGYAYVLPGKGEFPMARLRAALQAGNYRGLVSLEWERAWHSYLPPLEEALAAAEKNQWW